MMASKIDKTEEELAPISIRGLAVGAQAIGTLAVGSLAIGAVALGAVAIGPARDWSRKNQATGNRRTRREEDSYHGIVGNTTRPQDPIEVAIEIRATDDGGMTAVIRRRSRARLFAHESLPPGSEFCHQARLCMEWRR